MLHHPQRRQPSFGGVGKAARAVERGRLYALQEAQGLPLRAERDPLGRARQRLPEVMLADRLFGGARVERDRPLAITAALGVARQNDPVGLAHLFQPAAGGQVPAAPVRLRQQAARGVADQRVAEPIFDVGREAAGAEARDQLTIHQLREPGLRIVARAPLLADPSHPAAPEGLAEDAGCPQHQPRLGLQAREAGLQHREDRLRQLARPGAKSAQRQRQRPLPAEQLGEDLLDLRSAERQ